jgi:co-chaperonin GroES (HSP10)
LIKPNGDRVFIKKVDRSTQTASGLYLGIDPAKAKVENMGIIVAVGNDVKYTEGCKVGVRVCFDNMLELDMDIKGEEYVIIPENKIVCYFYDKTDGE